MTDVGAGFIWGRLLGGARFALSGITFTFRHKRLLAWSVVPMLVQVGLFVALLLAGLPFVGAAAGLGPAPGHWYSFVSGLLWFVAGAGLVIATVLLSLMLGSVVCDPFYDVLSEVTESILVGRDVSTRATLHSIVAGILREISALPWRLVMYAIVAVPLWLLSMTGIGAVIAMPLTLMWTWMFVTLSGMSRSLSRHAVPGRRRFVIIFSRPSVALGFGAVGWLLSHVPLTYPFLVVGGTRLYLALAAHDRLESNLTVADKYTLRAG